MGKIAFVFPGQGAQYTGMGKEFYDHFESARQVYQLADRSAGFSLEELCFEENDRLNITEYTQIAMLTTEVAILKVLEEQGIRADICAGLSLGEYGALAAAEVMSLEDLFHLIRLRGIYMQEAYPVGGAMSAVLGMDSEKILQICEQTQGTVSIANYNCPGQIVITGEARAVQAASETLTEAGAKRVVPLKVSGPFHSALLKNAADKLAAALAPVKLSDPKIPYVCNVDASYVTSMEPIKDLLSRQVVSSVCWQQSVERMLADGVDTFVEIGPGKTLTGFLRKIDRNATALNVEKLEDLEKVKQTLSTEGTTC